LVSLKLDLQLVNKIIFRTFCFLVIALNIQVYAQVKISPDVQTALLASKERSYSLKEKEHAAAKTELDAKKVKHKHIPTVSATGGIAHFKNDAVLDLTPITLPILPGQLFDGFQGLSAKGNIVGAGLMANSVLFSGLQIPKATKALKTKAEAERLLRDAESETVSRQVLIALDNLEVLKQVDVLLTESKKRLESEKKRVDKAIEVGLAIPFDRDKIVLASLELDAKSKEAEGTRNVLIEQLSYLTGFTSEEIRNIEHHFEVIPILNTNTLHLENKKELEALDLFIEAQNLNVERERNGILPQVAAFGGLQYARLFDSKATLNSMPISGNNLTGNLGKLEIWPNWIVGIGVKWEIFEGMQRKHRIDEAKLDMTLLEDKRKDSEEKLNLLLTKQKNDWQTQSEILGIARQRLHIATQNLERAEKQYKQGLLSINDRLSSENDYFAAALSLSQETAKQRELSIDLLITAGSFTQSIEVTP